MKNNKSLFIIIFLLTINILILSGCKDDKSISLSKDINVEQLSDPIEGDDIAIIKTNMGEIKIRLFPEVAPKAVENFITHSKNGYYDGLTFHRVMENFMIQGGDPEGNGTGGESIWSEPFEDEFNDKFRNYRGALSMANRGPDTNGSQFFIVQTKDLPEGTIEYAKEEGVANFSDEVIEKYKEVGGAPWLDNMHTVFGQVYEGMDVVDNIAAVEVDEMDMPLEDITIKSVRIIEYKK